MATSDRQALVQARRTNHQPLTEKNASSTVDDSDGEEFGISALHTSFRMPNSQEMTTMITDTEGGGRVDENGDVLTFNIFDERVRGDDSASAGVTVQLYQSPANDVEQVSCRSTSRRIY